MPRVAIVMVQGAGKPAFTATAAVAKANPGAYLTVLMANGGGTPTTTYNVLNYGAVGNGTTNDAPGIQAAYNAAFVNSVGGNHSTVFFPPGRTYLVSSGWNLDTIRTNDWYGQASPTVQRAGTIAFSGYGATIKYANATTRFCWLQGPNPTLQYQTYGNLTINGFTIDPNWRQPSGECGNAIWIQGKGNVDNVTFNDVTMIPNIAARTAASPSRTSNGILIIPAHTARTQTYYSYVTNITVNDSTLYGQSKALGIYAANMGSDTVYGSSKMLYDNINLNGVYANNLHHYGSAAHLGSYAAGYRCSVLNSEFENSTDDGLEIDAFNEVLVDGCTFSQCRQPVCFTWFSFPYKSDTPTYTLRNSTYSGAVESYWPIGTTPEPGNRSPMLPEFLDGGRADLNTRDHGHLVIDNVNGEFGITNSYDASLHRGFFQSNSRLASVTINNCDITDVGAGGSIVVVSQHSTGGNLPIHITDVRWRAAGGATAYTLLPLSKCTFGGNYTLTGDVV